MRIPNRLIGRVLDNHHLLTTVALLNLAGVFGASIFDLSDRTFFLLLAGLVGFGWLALRAADRATDAAIRHALADDPDPFAMQCRVEYRDTQTYDLTIGLLIPGDPQATEDSQSILRRLTRDDLITVIAQHGGHAWQALTPTGRLTVRGGAQLIWQPSTTDTTGETR